MAKGTITQTINSITGKVRVDDNEGDTRVPNGNEINYEDTSVPPLGLVVGDTVSFTIAPAGPGQFKATNLSKILTEPADEGTVKTGNVSGFTVPSGQTVTLKSATVNGDVHVHGKLIIKTNSVVQGRVHDHGNNAELLFYNSTIQERLSFSGSQKTITINNGSVGGDVDIRNIANGVSVDGLTLTGTNKDLEVKNNGTSTVLKNVTVNDGDAEIRNNVNVTIDGLTLNGAGRNLEIRNNRGNCTYNNITTH